jgi:hypothetical protein
MLMVIFSLSASRRHANKRAVSAYRAKACAPTKSRAIMPPINATTSKTCGRMKPDFSFLFPPIGDGQVGAAQHSHLHVTDSFCHRQHILQACLCLIKLHAPQMTKVQSEFQHAKQGDHTYFLRCFSTPLHVL